MKAISFYSFKGGVGRTALLTNLGAYWASRGKVVLLMDLDLAAPGLSYSLPGKMLDVQGRGQGMSELLDIFFKQVKKDPEQIQFLPPRHLIREVVFDEPKFKDAAGNLFFIPAGHRHFSVDRGVVERPDDEGIIPTIPGIKAEKGEKPEQTASRVLAYYLKEHLESWTVPEGPSKGKKIDYLLIDSRTGFAELRDLSLGYLADTMVLVSSVNEQNLKGLTLMLEALKSKRVPFDTFPLLVTLVFSPLPPSEDMQLFQQMEKAHRVIADMLRFSRAGQRELAPRIFPIHYNQILATKEILLVLEHPESLYAREITAVAHHLEGESKADDIQDYLVRETRRNAMKVIPGPKPEPAAPPEETKEFIRDIPLADLPPWYWPLPKEEQEEAKRHKILEALMPGNPNINMNREALANQLCWSISLSIDEKKRIMDSVPKLNQYQVDELSMMLDDERYKFMSLWTNKDTTREELLKLFFDHQREWAVAVLTDGKAANHRFFITAPEEHVFAVWEKWWKYWLMLARGLLVDLGETERAFEMVDRGAQIANDNNTVAIYLLELIDPKNVSLPILKLVEAHAVKLAPSEPWLNYLRAHNRLKEKPPDKKAAKELLTPLLKSPPQNARQCFSLTAFVLDDLPEIALQVETAARKAVELDPDYAPAWNSLGNLLKNHLNRYEESEAAYRKAVELDEKYAYPWNGLGNLYQDHLNSYEESEAAYRKAIELDEKYAYPWNGLGGLYQDYLNRYEESEAAYRKAIELDEKYAYPWNGLGNLYQYHFNRYEESEAAYRKAIELDEKFAYPWNGLGLLKRDIHMDCAGAIENFKKGLEISKEYTTAYLKMNLGHTYFLLGNEELALDYLSQSLTEFDRQPHYDANVLRIAIELNNKEKLEKYLPEAIKECNNKSLVSAAYLLLHGLVYKKEDIENYKKKTWELMGSYDEHFDLLRDLYYLSGFRPEARPRAARLVSELLTFPGTLIRGFKDKPKPDSWYDRYRPFSEGKSRGLGDPTDLHLFCKKEK